MRRLTLALIALALCAPAADAARPRPEAVVAKAERNANVMARGLGAELGFGWYDMAGCVRRYARRTDCLVIFRRSEWDYEYECETWVHVGTRTMNWRTLRCRGEETE